MTRVCSPMGLTNTRQPQAFWQVRGRNGATAKEWIQGVLSSNSPRVGSSADKQWPQRRWRRQRPNRRQARGKLPICGPALGMPSVHSLAHMSTRSLLRVALVHGRCCSSVACCVLPVCMHAAAVLLVCGVLGRIAVAWPTCATSQPPTLTLLAWRLATERWHL